MKIEVQCVKVELSRDANAAQYLFRVVFAVTGSNKRDMRTGTVEIRMTQEEADKYKVGYCYVLTLPAEVIPTPY